MDRGGSEQAFLNRLPKVGISFLCSAVALNIEFEALSLCLTLEQLVVRKGQCSTLIAQGTEYAHPVKCAEWAESIHDTVRTRFDRLSEPLLEDVYTDEGSVNSFIEGIGDEHYAIDDLGSLGHGDAPMRGHQPARVMYPKGEVETRTLVVTWGHEAPGGGISGTAQS